MVDDVQPIGNQPHLSIVVPLFNEEGNVAPLVEAVRAAVDLFSSWELILVDDGSTDGTPAVVRREAAVDPRIRLVRLGRNYGQALALQAGFDAAQGSVVVSMDGDLQNDPLDIPRLVYTLEQQDYDLVAGYRVRRQDPAHRRLPSIIANTLIGLLTGVRIRDTGCTLRAYRRELLDGLHLYAGLHRFIPAVAVAVRGARITELPVRHRLRHSGTSKYGLMRTPEVMADFFVLILIGSFRDRPLLMFSLGTLLALVCAALSALPFLMTLTREEDVAMSLLLPSLPFMWIELACFLLLLGLISEVILRWQRARLTPPPFLVRRRS